MANPERLELLRRGVEVWNSWRTKVPSVETNLNGANLVTRTSAERLNRLPA
jgi:hypothetical protein